MPVDVRTIRDDEYDRWLEVLTSVFAFEPKPEDVAIIGAKAESGRNFAAFDGDQLVGTTAVFSYQMKVPGGASVPTGGLTGVGVAPTHRRLGALTRMMRAYLEDCRDRDEVMGALWASESVIYGRYGFGVAALRSDATLPRVHSAMRVEGPAAGSIRAVEVGEARTIVPDLHLAAGAEIPGWMGRRPSDWDGYFHDPGHWREGFTQQRFVVFESGDRVTGYLRYRLKEKWEDAHPRYELEISDLQALDSDAYAALFRFAFGVDLVETISIGNRRVREPLTAMLVEPRRLRRRISDSIWVRPIDIAGALSARKYSVDGDLVIEVRDDFCPWVEGRYRLVGGPEGAECERTDANPDVVLSAADLGASYLGDARFFSRAWGGLVDGASDDVLLAQRMFGWHIEPWCTTFF